mgnify:CR=1 FL=1
MLVAWLALLEAVGHTIILGEKGVDASSKKLAESKEKRVQISWWVSF